MNFCPPSTLPPNAESKRLVETLRLLMYIQLVVGFLKLFTQGTPSIGFSDLICCLFVYQGYNSLMHSYMITAFFLEGFAFVRLFAVIGAIIQNDKGFFNGQNTYFPTTFGAVICLLSVPLYLAIMSHCFFAYREFKALAYEGLGGGFGPSLLGGGSGSYLPATSQQPQYDHDAREETSSTNSSFQAFAGRGVRLG